MKNLKKFGIALVLLAVVSLSVALPADARLTQFYDSIDTATVTTVGGESVSFTLLQKAVIAETVFHTLSLPTP